MSTFDINVSVFIFYLEHQNKLPPRVQRIVICKILIRRFFVALCTVGVREKPRVFYVEDDRDIRDLTQYALRQAGFECVGFSDATEFFAACADCLPDLVLLDIMLPGIDGREILSRIRDSATLRELPVIMLTAKGTEFDVISGLDAGADDYLAKPFSMKACLYAGQKRKTLMQSMWQNVWEMAGLSA